MANPTWKSEQVESQLSTLFGFDRRGYIGDNVCVPPPIGCGQPIEAFRNELQEKEYRISGLCGNCQDKIFGNNEGNWEE